MTLPLNFRGKQYPSIRAAALDHGLCVTSLWRAVHIGVPEQAGKLPRRAAPMPVTVNGVAYPSCAAAAAELGYHRTTIVTYLRRLGNNLRIPPKSPAEAALTLSEPQPHKNPERPSSAPPTQQEGQA